MKQKITVLTNPHSGIGQANTIKETVVQFLHKYQVSYALYQSEYSGHIPHLICEDETASLTQSTLIIVIGGDGTLHETVSALYKIQVQVPILYLPSGTGNDFARVEQPNRTLDDSLHLLQRFLKGDRSCMREVPILSIKSDDVKTISLNSIGFGFDATVNYNAQNMIKPSWFPMPIFSKLKYIAALFTSLDALQQFDVVYRVNAQDTERLKGCQIVSVMNHRYIGGGIQLDTLGHPVNTMSFVAIHANTARDVLALIWQILVSKDAHKAVSYSHQVVDTIELSIKGEGIRCQIDGENYTMSSAAYNISISHYPFIG